MLSQQLQATRILGFVNAPSLMQRVVAKCVDAQVNLEAYDKNRKVIYEKDSQS